MPYKNRNDRAEYDRHRRPPHRPDVARLNERARERYERNQAHIRAIKLARGCIDCGYREHHAALHFDHRDRTTKSMSIGTMTTRSIAAIDREIAKCDVRCANCHYIKTFDTNGRSRIKHHPDIPDYVSPGRTDGSVRA